MKFDLMVFKFLMFHLSVFGISYRWRVLVNQRNPSVTVKIIKSGYSYNEVAVIEKEFETTKDITQSEVRKLKKELWADAGPELMEKHRLSRLS